MLASPGYTLRVIWACMKKDIKSALTERVFTIISIFVPVNILILLSLFVISGGLAPTAVVMNDTGPYARQFYNAMNSAHSFSLQTASASNAASLIQRGKIVAVVTIPADFDARIQQNQPVQVRVDINNVNVPSVSDRGLLRSCPRWPRPGQKVVGCIQDVNRCIGIPVKFAPAFARVPPL
jgi:ABC-2 type transport system permease protein